MPTSEKQIVVDCPLSNDTHPYDVEVGVSILYGYEDKGEPPVKRTYQRFFTCPVKSQIFQADITLTQYPGQRIDRVDVIGPSDPKDQ
jgi:hypothetical protein